MKKFLLFASAAVIAASASAQERNVIATMYPGDAAFIGWGGESTREVVTEDGRECFKFTNPTEADAWGVQFAYDMAYEVGTTYYFEFDVKGDAFEGMTSGFQCTDGYAACGNMDAFNITADWNTVTIKGTPTDPGEGKAVDRWVANAGKFVGTFYISKVTVYTLEEGGVTPPATGWTSIIDGGNANDGESASLQANWDGNAQVTDNPAGDGKVYACPIAADPSNPWDSQLFIKFNEPQTAGTKLKVSFDYYCTDARAIDVQAQGAAGAYHHWTVFGYGLEAKPEWQKLNWEGEVSAEMAGEDGFQTIAFNLASLPEAATFYINNVVVEKESSVAVEAVAVESNVATGVYNMQGMRVADTLDQVSTPGLYIANGKKVIKK